MSLTLADLVERCTGCKNSEVKDRLLAASSWPPDIFAYAAMFLQMSGAYRLAVAPLDDHSWPPNRTWASEVVVEAKGYAEKVEQWLLGDDDWGEPAPLEYMVHEANRQISELGADWEFVRRTLHALALADEACGGVGLPGGTGHPNIDSQAMQLLSQSNTCTRLPSNRVRVLPKVRTPQCGISLRSLSGNIALVGTGGEGEVRVGWHHVDTDLSLPKRHDPSSLDILLLPWPLEVFASDFSQSDAQTTCVVDPDEFGFFDFEPEWTPDIDGALDLVERAREIGGGPQLVVLPESALDRPLLGRLRAGLLDRYGTKSPAVLSGIRDKRGSRPFNTAVLSYVDATGTWREYVQDKHHRWFLDSGQIRTYQLGSRLHPNIKWWESMGIPQRSLNFFALADSVVLCTLVCEDLARQDPVSPIVRAVGPTLLIALLLDGPQVAGRWGSRHATVLAEDPGSSTLTVSSLGMVKRSHTPGYAPSRAIALWKDSVNGQKSIELEEGQTAALLTVNIDWTEEWLADGRRDRGAAAVLTLADHRGL